MPPARQDAIRAPAATPAEGLPVSNEDRFLHLLYRLRALGAEAPPFEAFQISPAQLMLLGWIANHPGCHIQDVATGLGLTSPTVSVGLRRLEQSGLLRREPDPTDKRARRLFLTPQGEHLHQQVLAFRRAKARQFLSGLTAAEQETLLTLWERALQAAESASHHLSPSSL